MGSDNLCDATGLPITSKDPVVGFAVSTQPLKGYNYADSPWAYHIPVSFAFRGKYYEDFGFHDVEGSIALDVLAKEGRELGLQTDNLDRLVSELSAGGFILTKFKDFQKNLVETNYLLYMVRADVFEFLKNDKHLETLYDERGLRCRAREDAQIFLEGLDKIFDNPEDHFDLFPEKIEGEPELKKRMAARKEEGEERYKDIGGGFLESKLFNSVSVATGEGRRHNAFADMFTSSRAARSRVNNALFDYRTWLIDAYQEGRRSDDAEIQQFVEDTIDFTIFDANLTKFGLTWTPKGRGRDQFKDREPFVEFFQFCLDRAKEFKTE